MFDSFSRKTRSYRSRPRPRSQPPISILGRPAADEAAAPVFSKADERVQIFNRAVAHSPIRDCSLGLAWLLNLRRTERLVSARLFGCLPVTARGAAPRQASEK